jgi:UDPglucose 6-dehydrogenase
LIGSSRTEAGLAAAAALEEIYSAWVPRSRIVTVNLWSSELSKLVANAMLAQRISSINTVSAICERTGADVDEIAKAIGLDPRLGPKFLKAGLGFGGSCFKKDILSLVYLAETLNLEEVAEYWRQVITINEFQRNRFVKRVVSNLHGALIGKKISILGYAFKKDTSDTRESPAVEVVKSLLADNPAEIAIFDPRCNPEDVKDEIKQLFATTGLKLLKPDGPIEGKHTHASLNPTANNPQSTKIPMKPAAILVQSSSSPNGTNSATHPSKPKTPSSTNPTPHPHPLADRHWAVLLPSSISST